MHREGHFGLGLLVFAPIAYGLLLTQEYALVPIGAAVVSGTASLPDVDQRVRFISHRGPTHTIWFALAVGAACGAGGYLLGTANLPLVSIDPLQTALVAGVVGTLTVLSHLVGDIITPAGLRPLSPLSRKKYTLDIVLARSPIANYGFLVTGFLASGAALIVGTGGIP